MSADITNLGTVNFQKHVETCILKTKVKSITVIQDIQEDVDFFKNIKDVNIVNGVLLNIRIKIALSYSTQNFVNLKPK